MPESDSTNVVLRFRDGRAVRCQMERPFSPTAAVVDAITTEGECVTVGLHELKALFFVKDPRQRDADLAMGERAAAPPGSALTRVEFFDGEVIRGRVQHFSIADKGFFLYPTAVESNNERVFVVARAVTSVDIES